MVARQLANDTKSNALTKAKTPDLDIYWGGRNGLLLDFLLIQFMVEKTEGIAISFRSN